MRTVALYLVLVLGVAGIGSGVFLFGTAYAYRARNSRGGLVYVAGLGAFFLVIGSLALTAFAVPSTRHWAILSIGLLLVARGLVLLVVERVIKRRVRRIGL
jgi:FtsH-binding integral membrane protein